MKNKKKITKHLRLCKVDGINGTCFNYLRLTAAPDSGSIRLYY